MFKISEFARIASVSVHTLRHYDSISLFQPCQTDPQSGYRYYSVEQLPHFHRIMALRELGLSLEQIKTLMGDAIGDCEIRGMLLLKQKEVEREIEASAQRLRSIMAHLRQLEAVAPMQYDVLVKDAPACQFLSTGHITVSDATVGLILEEAYAMLMQHNDVDAYASLVLVRDHPTAAGLVNVEVGYPVQACYPDGIQLSTGHRLTVRPLPPIATLATVIHDGARASNRQAYEAVFTWMEANGYHFLEGEYAREIYLKPGQHRADAANIVEIQIPICQSMREEPPAQQTPAITNTD